MTATVGLGTIGQIAVPVQDVERALAFYRDTLGMRFLFRAPPALAFFDCGGIRLLLDRPEKPEFARHSSVIYFRVDDIQKSYDIFRGRGVAFEGAPHAIHKTDTYELKMAFFRDSEDNILALMSETGSLL
jgi:catechol 2,3-dioxygenase-like lactoylglutathione lyase family enzyme